MRGVRDSLMESELSLQHMADRWPTDGRQKSEGKVRVGKGSCSVPVRTVPGILRIYLMNGGLSQLGVAQKIDEQVGYNIAINQHLCPCSSAPSLLSQSPPSTPCTHLEHR